MRTLLRYRLFTRHSPAQNGWAIIKWWELRRIPYNFIVGLAGMMGGAVSLALAFIADHRGIEVPMPDPPIFLLILVLLYGIAANLCFTGGWISELLARWIWGRRAEAYGEIAFLFGTVFSVGLTLFPSVIFSVAVTIQLILKS